MPLLPPSWRTSTEWTCTCARARARLCVRACVCLTSTTAQVQEALAPTIMEYLDTESSELQTGADSQRISEGSAGRPYAAHTTPKRVCHAKADEASCMAESSCTWCK